MDISCVCHQDRMGHEQYPNLKMDMDAGLILGLRPANERRHYFVTMSLIGWAQI